MSGYREHPPCPALAPYVRCYWTHRENPSRPRTRRVVPDACLDLVFRLDASAPEALAVGAMTVPLPVRSEGPTDLLGVRFRTGAAATFLRLPAGELTDLRVPLSELWRGGARSATERLAGLPPGPVRLAVLDALLLDRLAAPSHPPDPAVLAAVALLRATAGAVSVGELAARVGLGRRQLGRRFRSSVGLPPKTTARVLRFQAALTRLLGDGGEGLSRVALASGYHDQPHFTREFTALAGEPPGAYRRRRSPGPEGS